MTATLKDVRRKLMPGRGLGAKRCFHLHERSNRGAFCRGGQAGVSDGGGSRKRRGVEAVQRRCLGVELLSLVCEVHGAGVGGGMTDALCVEETTMTKKDYELVAKVLRSSYNEAKPTRAPGNYSRNVTRRLAERFADALAEENSRFDRGRFLAASLREETPAWKDLRESSENPREKDDDDGVEYGDPRDERRSRR